MIKSSLPLLKQNERKVLMARLGIDDGCPKTLEEIGKILNVTRERVRQIEAKALRKLKLRKREKC